jgi:hypothetical protein
MAPQRHRHQSIDPFVTLSTYHVQRLYRARELDRIAQASRSERRRTLSLWSVVPTVLSSVASTRIAWWAVARRSASAPPHA